MVAHHVGLSLGLLTLSQLACPRGRDPESMQESPGWKPPCLLQPNLRNDIAVLLNSIDPIAILAQYVSGLQEGTRGRGTIVGLPATATFNFLKGIYIFFFRKEAIARE